MTENRQPLPGARTDGAEQLRGVTRADPTPHPGRRRLVIGAAALLAVGGVGGGTAWANAGSTGSPGAIARSQAGPAVDPSETTSAPTTSSGADSPSSSGSTNDPAAPQVADGSQPTPPKPRPHLDGTVSSSADGTITIKDHEGFTRVINVSGTTTFSDSLTATPAEGTEIHAEGTVNADGVSLDATAVGKQPKPPAGGPGNGPKGPGAGPDRPGVGGPQPPKGSEAPTTSGTDGNTSAPSDAPQSPGAAPVPPSDGPSAPSTTTG